MKICKTLQVYRKNLTAMLQNNFTQHKYLPQKNFFFSLPQHFIYLWLHPITQSWSWKKKSSKQRRKYKLLMALLEHKIWIWWCDSRACRERNEMGKKIVCIIILWILLLLLLSLYVYTSWWCRKCFMEIVCNENESCLVYNFYRRKINKEKLFFCWWLGWS